MAVPIHGGHRPEHVLRASTVLALLVVSLLEGCGDAAPEQQRAAPPVAPDDVRELVGGYESWRWYAVLVEPGGQVRALRQRIDHIELARQPDAPGERAVSDWRFDAVMLADGARSMPGTAPRQWRSLQREAVGLASRSAAAGSLTAQVLEQGLRFEPAAPDACAGTWEIGVMGEYRLQAEQLRCPALRTLDALRLSEPVPMRVTSESGGQGVAWLRHLRGEPPPGDGAVALDVATLTLQRLGTLEVVRSRRRSGRGREVVTARLLGRPAGQASIEAQWQDGAAGQPTRVVVPALGVDLTLQLLPLAASAARSVAGSAGPAQLLDEGPGWQGVLLASGSHRGAGYAELANRSPEQP